MLEFFDFLLKRFKILKDGKDLTAGKCSNNETDNENHDRLNFRASDDNSSEIGNYEESTHFVLKDSEKSLLVQNTGMNMRDISHFVNFRGLPLLYFIVSISLIPLMFGLTYIKDIPRTCYNKIGSSNVLLLNYFHFSAVSPLIVYVVEGICSLIGLMIVMIIMFYLKNRIGDSHKEKEFSFFSSYRLNIFKVTVMGLFGFLAFLVLYISSTWAYFSRSQSYNDLLYKEIGFTVPEFLLVIRSFFTAIWVTFFLIMITDFRKQGNLNEFLGNTGKHTALTNYKIVTCIYLSLTTLIYILARLHLEGFLTKFYSNHSEVPYKDSFLYINAILPYLIHIIIDLLVLTFAMELKSIKLSISQLSLNSTINAQEKNSL